VVNASGSVLADAFSASIKFVLAAYSGVVFRACAVQAGTEVLTLRPVHARVANASFWTYLAHFTVSSRWADAEEVFEQINTLSIVQARILVTTSNVLLAALSGPSSLAIASVICNSVDADSTIQAWIMLAFVNISFTEFTSKSNMTLAFKHVVKVNAFFSSYSITRATYALIGGSFALQADKPRTALANKTIEGIRTGGCILTGI
jgi:hypothetical protein